jgi:hypothetical protein
MAARWHNAPTTKAFEAGRVDRVPLTPELTLQTGILNLLIEHAGPQIADQVPDRYEACAAAIRAGSECATASCG